MHPAQLVLVDVQLFLRQVVGLCLLRELPSKEALVVLIDLEFGLYLLQMQTVSFLALRVLGRPIRSLQLVLEVVLAALEVVPVWLGLAVGPQPVQAQPLQMAVHHGCVCLSSWPR